MRTCTAFIVKVKWNEKNTVKAPVQPPWLWSVAGIHTNGCACQETWDERGNPKDPLGREVGELVNIVWFLRSRGPLESVHLKPAQSMQLPPSLNNHHPVLSNVLHVGPSYMPVALLSDSWYYGSRDRDVMVELCGSHYQYFQLYMPSKFCFLKVFVVVVTFMHVCMHMCSDLHKRHAYEGQKMTWESILSMIPWPRIKLRSLAWVVLMYELMHTWRNK